MTEKIMEIVLLINLFLMALIAFIFNSIHKR